jgi:hypothetical protein
MRTNVTVEMVRRRMGLVSDMPGCLRSDLAPHAILSFLASVSPAERAIPRQSPGNHGELGNRLIAERTSTTL